MYMHPMMERKSVYFFFAVDWEVQPVCCVNIIIYLLRTKAAPVLSTEANGMCDTQYALMFYYYYMLHSMEWMCHHRRVVIISHNDIVKQQ